MTEKVDFLSLITDGDRNVLNNFWLDDKQFKFIPHKLLVPPYNVDLSLVYPKDTADNDLDKDDDLDNLDDFLDDNDDLDENEDDYPIDIEKPNQLPVREVTMHFVHGSIVDSIMNSNMDEEAKWKTIRMLNTAEAHIVKPNDLSDETSTHWDDWAYSLEKLNSHANGYTVLKNFEGHLYPDDYNIVEFKIVNLPDVEFLPFDN